MAHTATPQHTSRLATVIVADIVGFSRLMDMDEAATYAALSAIRSKFVEPAIEAGGGRIVKHLGDGFLAEFPSVLAAVESAVAIQNALRSSSGEIPEDRRIRFRIGINLGDVIVDEDGDVFGDGVNVAARLEALALPGGVCVSASVRDSVHKRLEAEFEDLGEQSVKNIQTPVHAYHMHWPEESRFGRHEPGRLRSFVTELNRRQVLRVAVAYLAAAWLLTEIASTLFPVFGLGERGLRLIVYLLTVGLLPVLLISWAYELTPQGLKREGDFIRRPADSHTRAKRLDLVTIGLVVCALSFVVFDRTSRAPEPLAREGAVVSEDAPADKSVAVLPFVNMSADTGNEHFSDGISEELIYLLSTIPELRVIARTSAFSYKNRNVRVAQVGSELKVGHVLEGSVRKAGDRVRITAQLVDAGSEERIWSEVFDRQLTAETLFLIQSEIAEAIAGELETVLSPTERQRLRVTPTQNLEAYDLYLLGKQHLADQGSADLLQATDRLQEAVDLDPEFALAWVALAEAYIELWISGDVFSPEESMARARDALETALRLDPELGQAYTALGDIEYRQNNLEGAMQHFERALALTPNEARLRERYGSLLAEIGQREESLQWRQEAMRLDPMSAKLRREYAVALRTVGRTAEAMEQLQMALQIDPDYPEAIDNIATMHWQIHNRMDEALRIYSRLPALDPMTSMHFVFIGQIYLDLDEPDRASRLIGRAIELAPDGRFTHWGKLLQQLYLGLEGGVVESAELLLAQPIRASWVPAFSAAQLGWRKLEAGQEEAALEVYATHYPDLMRQGMPEVDWRNYRAAIDLAAILQRMGEGERADRLLDRTLEYIREEPRLGWWSGTGISDVQILVLQGKKEEAMAALRQAVDEGWRTLWWYYLRQDPILQPLREEPAFRRILAEVEADVAAQMDRVREMERNGEIPPLANLTSAANAGAND